MVLGGRQFLMGKVPLYGSVSIDEGYFHAPVSIQKASWLNAMSAGAASYCNCARERHEVTSPSRHEVTSPSGQEVMSTSGRSPTKRLVTSWLEGLVAF